MTFSEIRYYYGGGNLVMYINLKAYYCIFILMLTLIGCSNKVNNQKNKNCFSREKAEAIALSAIKEIKGNEVKLKLDYFSNLMNEYSFQYIYANKIIKPGNFWTIYVDKSTCKTIFYPGK